MKSVVPSRHGVDLEQFDQLYRRGAAETITSGWMLTRRAEQKSAAAKKAARTTNKELDLARAQEGV